MVRISPLRLHSFLPSSLLDLVFARAHERPTTLHQNHHGFLSFQPQNGRRGMSMLYEPLNSLRLAINDRDLNEVKKNYKELATGQSLGIVTYRDWQSLSFMLESHPALSEYDEYDEELAIHCAARGFITPLVTLMSLHFKGGYCDNVISLYDRYFMEYKRMSALSFQASRTDTATSDPMSNDVIIVDNIEFKYTPPSVYQLLMFLVVAHVVKGDFDGAYSRFMDTPTVVRVSAPMATAFCNANLTDHPDIARRVKSWVTELVLCRLVSRKSSIDRYFMGLAKDNNVGVLEDLYQRIIEHCDNPGRVLCIVQTGQELAETDGSKHLAVPEDVWASFIRAFSKCARHDLVGKLWVDLRSRGLVPNRHVRNALLEVFNSYGCLDKATAVWKDMLDAGIEPNEISYGAMIQTYFRNHKLTEALAMFEQFRKNTKVNVQGAEAIRDQALLPLYNIVLHGLLTNNSYPKAQTLLGGMQKYGPEPDITTYNIFLRFHGRVRDLQAVGNTLQKMKECNIDPDVYSFTTVLTALYKIGKRDAHTHLLNIMMSMGLQPNVAMYSAIINWLVQEGGQANLKNAISLLHHMENDSDKESRPNKITYTSLLGGIHRDSSLTSDQVKMYTKDIFARMRRNGILPNRTTYHHLIKASLENREAQGLQLGFQYYKEMEDRGITMTDRTWYVLLSSLLRRGDVEKAGDVVNDIHRKGHQPDEALAKLIDRVEDMSAPSARWANLLGSF